MRAALAATAARNMRLCMDAADPVDYQHDTEVAASKSTMISCMSERTMHFFESRVGLRVPTASPGSAIAVKSASSGGG